MRQVLVRLAAPAASPVTLAEVKDHLAIDPAETIHDAVLAGLIEVATAHFDAAEGLPGRCLITQHWRLVLDRFPADIALPLPPLQRIEAVRYAALDGTVRTLLPGDYRAVRLADGRARLCPLATHAWPGTAVTPEAVEIDFVAGYGDAPGDVPAPIRQAIKMHVATLFAHREAAGGTVLAEVPGGVADLIAGYRLWSF